MKSNNWIVDVTFGKPYAFCPIEDDGSVVFGLNMIQDRCPGNLVGVVHSDGQEAVEKWCEENPTWHADLCANNELSNSGHKETP